jgi:hypothetical protein
MGINYLLNLKLHLVYLIYFGEKFELFRVLGDAMHLYFYIPIFWMSTQPNFWEGYDLYRLNSQTGGVELNLNLNIFLILK